MPWKAHSETFGLIPHPLGTIRAQVSPWQCSGLFQAAAQHWKQDGALCLDLDPGLGDAVGQTQNGVMSW